MKVRVHLLTYICFIIYALSGYISLIFPVMIVLFLHELGHIIAIKILNHKINKIEIFPFGFLIEEDKLINSNIKEELIISLSGIFIQIFFHLILLLFFKNALYFNVLYMANIFIMLFNLCPVYPLDGYTSYSCLLELYFPYKKTFILKLIINSLFIFIMIFFLDYSFILIDFLIFKFITELKKYKEYYHKFILEKIIYKINYSKVRVIDNKISSMYRNTYHYFNVFGKIHKEEDFLTNKVDN